MNTSNQMNSHFKTIRMHKEIRQNQFNNKDVFPANLFEMAYFTEVIDALYFLNWVNIVLSDWKIIYKCNSSLVLPKSLYNLQ